MENYISLLLATLTHLKLVTEKDAEKIDKKLRESTIPGNFTQAKALVSEIFDKVQNK